MAKRNDLLVGETYQVKLKPRRSGALWETSWNPMMWNGAAFEYEGEKYAPFAVESIGLRVDKNGKDEDPG